jgi:hypothetical protein
MDALTLRLLIIFIPGFISFFIIKALTAIKIENNYYAFIASFVLGFLVYLTFWPIYSFFSSFSCIPFFNSDYSIVSSILNSETKLDAIQVLLGAAWGVLLGIFSSFVINRKLFHRLMQYMSITTKFAETDVWSFAMNLEDPNLEWIYLRDFENDHLYFGNVRAFSSSSTECELLLSEVKVYVNSSGEYIYDMPLIYLSRDVKKISIEFPSHGGKNE